jgi:hypothetical protein
MNAKQRERRERDADRLAAFHAATCARCLHQEAQHIHSEPYMGKLHSNTFGPCKAEGCRCREFVEREL